MKICANIEDIKKLSNDEFEKMYGFLKMDLDEVSNAINKEFEDCTTFENVGYYKLELGYNADCMNRCREHKNLLKRYKAVIDKMLCIYENEFIYRFDEDFGGVPYGASEQITDEEKETLNYLLKTYKPEPVV